jgi:DNA-binding NarL/FixJ family response regulator
MSQQQQRTRIVVATPHTLLRDAMRTVMESEPDLEVVGGAPDGYQAVRECERTWPDVSILDEHLRNWDAVRTAGAIRERVPRCRVVILSNGDSHISLLNALEAGASGYISKNSAVDELIGTIRAVHAGRILIPHHMLGPLLTTLIDEKKQREEAIVKMVRLTQREREVLAILAEGGDNTTIAGKLVISPRTAKTHIQSVLSKLGLHSRLEAAAFVRRNGFRANLMRAANE